MPRNDKSKYTAKKRQAKHTNKTTGGGKKKDSSKNSHSTKSNIVHAGKNPEENMQEG